MGSHNVLQSIFDAGQFSQLPDPGSGGTIRVDRSPCACPLVSAGAEARTIAVPVLPGAQLLIYGKTVAGTITLTFTSGMDENDLTTFSITQAGQFIKLESIEAAADTFRWRKVADYASALITPEDAAVLDDLSGLTATAAELNARAAAASRIVNVTDAATYTVLAADSGKIHIIPDLTANCELTLPAASAGLEYTFIGKGVAADAQNWVFKSPSATNFFLGGVGFLDNDAGAGADEVHAGIYSNGSSNDFLTVVTPAAGTRIYMICDGTNWIVNGIVISATVPAFSDT